MLEKETQNSDFWQDKEKAVETNQKLSRLEEDVKSFDVIEKDFKDIESLSDLGESELMEKEIKRFEGVLKKEEVKVFLSGEYDGNNAILSIYSGAGGQDAQDWAAMLLRMYERHCATKGFKAKILNQSFGEGGGPDGRIGIKQASMEVKGNFAFGLLKGENGVHRLVRISPFSAKDLRHTSFALVEVLPDIKIEDADVEIKSDDIKIDLFRSSGPGGQNVNKRETAVRLTHIPTGLIVACQSERTQGSNREMAMKMLIGKLSQIKKEEGKKELKEIKGDNISASWGNQIRSYVLHPYKLVKDLRTGLENSNPESVLDGNLEEFIESELRLVKND